MLNQSHLYKSIGIFGQAKVRYVLPCHSSNAQAMRRVVRTHSEYSAQRNNPLESVEDEVTRVICAIVRQIHWLFSCNLQMRIFEFARAVYLANTSPIQIKNTIEPFLPDGLGLCSLSENTYLDLQHQLLTHNSELHCKEANGSSVSKFDSPFFCPETALFLFNHLALLFNRTVKSGAC